MALLPTATPPPCGCSELLYEQQQTLEQQQQRIDKQEGLIRKLQAELDMLRDSSPAPAAGAAGRQLAAWGGAFQAPSAGKPKQAAKKFDYILSEKGGIGISRSTRAEGMSWQPSGARCEIFLKPPLTNYMMKGHPPRYKNIRSSTFWELLEKYSTGALTVLDVGAHDPYVLSQLTWVPTKVALDLQYGGNQLPVWQKARGMIFLQSDIFKTGFRGRQFDIVTCTQVVEHIPNGTVTHFVRRMMQLAKTLIVTTTFELPYGVIHGHVQDPISQEKFRSWFDHPDVPGRIVHYAHNNPDANPATRNTIGSQTKGDTRRYEALQQVVVWQAAEGKEAIR